MPESSPDTTVMLGKGKRVVGTFLLLLGAGIVLESSLRWLGGTLMLGGIVAFVRGALETRPGTVAEHPTPVAIDAHSESRL